MQTVFYDPTWSDEERRERLFSGQIAVYSPRPSTLALGAFVRELLEREFAPLDPTTAQFWVEPDDFLARVAPASAAVLKSAKSTGHLRTIMQALGCDLAQTYYSLPAMRHPPSGDYLGERSTALALHRDTWFACPFAQVNWWIPIYDLQPRNCLAFYPRYWTEGVPNSSGEYFPFAPPSQIRKPTVAGPLALDGELRVVCPAGSIILFSGAQLHGTVPNTSGRTRYSVEFRTVHLDDLRQRRGAPDVDTACTGNILGRYGNARDLSLMPDEIVALYDEELVSEPPDQSVTYDGLLELMRRRARTAAGRTPIEEP